MQKGTRRFSRATFPSECQCSSAFLVDTLQLDWGPTTPLWHVLGRFKMGNRCMRAAPSTAYGDLKQPSVPSWNGNCDVHSTLYSTLPALAVLALVRQPQFTALFMDQIAEAIDPRTVLMGP